MPDMRRQIIARIVQLCSLPWLSTRHAAWFELLDVSSFNLKLLITTLQRRQYQRWVIPLVEF